jgi:hypothetical protein
VTASGRLMRWTRALLARRLRVSDGRVTTFERRGALWWSAPHRRRRLVRLARGSQGTTTKKGYSTRQPPPPPEIYFRVSRQRKGEIDPYMTTRMCIKITSTERHSRITTAKIKAVCLYSSYRKLYYCPRSPSCCLTTEVTTTEKKRPKHPPLTKPDGLVPCSGSETHRRKLCRAHLKT